MISRGRADLKVGPYEFKVGPYESTAPANRRPLRIEGPCESKLFKRGQC